MFRTILILTALAALLLGGFLHARYDAGEVLPTGSGSVELTVEHHYSLLGLLLTEASPAGTDGLILIVGRPELPRGRRLVVHLECFRPIYYDDYALRFYTVSEP